MKSILSLLPAFVFVLLVLSSCEKETKTGINLSFKGDISSLKSDNLSGVLTISEAYIGVHEIEIEIEMETEHEQGESEMEIEYEFEYEYEGDYTVDLLTGKSTPEFGFSELEPGVYNEVEAELSPILEGGTKSVSIKGTFTDTDQMTIEFEFSTSAEIEIEVESETGFFLDEASILDLVVSFDLEMLFDGVDFSNAVRNEMDVVIIDEKHNVDLAQKIKANISLYVDLEEDDEDDD
jgi:hypothetical protein